MEDLISIFTDPDNIDHQLSAIQELSNLITKITLSVEQDKIVQKSLSKEELIKKENERRALLKSSNFIQGCKNSLNPETNVEIILSIIQFFNDLIKVSKDKITDRFIKDHLSPLVILLGHHKVRLLTLEYRLKGGVKGHFKIL